MTLQHWNRRAIISHLYVDRDERCSGVGGGLLLQARDRASALGARCLWVETQDLNAPAIRFYRQNGFALCGLDTMLYDPREIQDETAVFLVPSLEGSDA